MLAHVICSLAPCSKTDVVFLGHEQLCVVAYCFEPLDYFCGYLTAIFILSQYPIGGTLAKGIYAVSCIT